MPSLKEFNVKLASLRNTRKMTRTMKMVSASKLHKAQEAQRSASRYATQLTQMIARLAASVSATAHPLLESRTPVRKALLLVYTSDKGLCAGFNNNLVKASSQWIQANRNRFEALELSCIGKRGYDFFRKRETVHTHYEGVTNRPHSTDAIRISTELRTAFLSGEFDEVYIAHNEFKNVLTQTPTITKLLPVEPTLIQQDQEKRIANYIFEPEEATLLAMLLPKIVDFKVYFSLLENAAGEHGARMTAMDNATSNADSMIDRYTLLRNRARQAAITTELIEIISGAEAL